MESSGKDMYLYFIIKNYSKYVEIHVFRFSAHSVSIVNWRLKVPFVFCGNQPKYFSRYYHELILTCSQKHLICFAFGQR